MTTNKDRLLALRDELRDFCAARHWQGYHSPKNLAMAMIVEAAELVEHFQWATPFIEPVKYVNIEQHSKTTLLMGSVSHDGYYCFYRFLLLPQIFVYA